MCDFSPLWPKIALQVLILSQEDQSNRNNYKSITI